MNTYPLYPKTPMGDRMVADIGEPPLDPPDADPEDCKFCTDCGCGWDEHRRVGEYPRYEYRCPEPPEGRWVGTWPEELYD